jgi:hypothetical protein
MPPIRVGLIGLSGASPEKYEGTSWTAMAHLPYLRASPDYKIVALLNSSVESAQAAIKKYDLPGETKAYGDPKGELFRFLPYLRPERVLMYIYGRPRGGQRSRPGRRKCAGR